MIDPNILLQSKPVNIETPLEAQGQVQQVQNLKNIGQIQQGAIAMQPGALQQQAQQVAAGEQENQIRQLAIDNQKFTNAAIAQNVKVGTDGKPYIDHAGVVGSLTASGHGSAALAYQTAATAVQKGVTELQQANETLQNAHTQNLGAIAGAVLNVPLGPNGDTTARAATFAAARMMAIQNHQLNPGDIPDVYNPGLDARLGALRDAALGAKGQEDVKLGAERVGALQDRARAAESQAQAANERANTQAAYQRYSPTARTDKEGHPLSFDHQTNSYVPATDIVENPTGAPSARSTTAAHTANQREFDTAQAEEHKQDSLRDTLGNALKNRDMYVDATGKSVPFQRLIPRLPDEDMEDYNQRIAPQVKSLMQQMQNRYDAATQAANDATARKNNATIANGGIPDVSTAQASAKRGGKPGAAPAAAPGGKQQYSKGQTVYKGGKPYTISAINSNGSLQLTPK